MAPDKSDEQKDTQERQEAPPARPNEAGVGALLKASRLRVGQDLRDIADVLRIRYVYMEAIEDGRYDALPGPTYAAGFIRAYAEHLGLDSEEVVRRFKAEGTAGREAADLVFPEPIPEPGIPGGAVILVGIVVAVVAYGAWYVNTSKDGFLVELVSPLPDRLANLVENEGKPAGQAAPAAPVAAPAVTPTPPQSQPPTQPQTAATPAAPPATEADAKPEAAATTPEAKPEAKPEVAAVSPEATPEAKPEATAATPDATPQPQPQPQPEAKPEPSPAAVDTAAATPRDASPAETSRAAPAPTTPETPAAAPVPESRETPVATARPPAPAAPIEPVIAPGNVPVDMIPPPRPATTTTTTTAAVPPPATEPAAAPAPAATASAAPAVAATAIGEAGTRILVRAKTNSWIQVRDDNANELLVTRLLRSGDSYAVPNRAGLRLSTGNAGALEILVDGDVVPAIGDDGAVRRNVLLDAEKLKAGQAVTE